MKRNRSIQAFIAVAALIAGSAIAFAYNGIEHVLGTVKSVTKISITVETIRHEVTTIALDPTTTFTNKGAKASLMDLKVADRVAIDTKDDADDKPHAVSVRWGATPGTSKATTKKTDSKMDPNMKM